MTRIAADGIGTGFEAVLAAFGAVLAGFLVNGRERFDDFFTMGKPCPKPAPMATAPRCGFSYHGDGRGPAQAAGAGNCPQQSCGVLLPKNFVNFSPAFNHC